MKRLQSADESVFWYFVTERHAIYQRRTAGQSKPWSQDSIFQNYKFTNVFRQLDRGTVWLTENFIKPHWGAEPSLLVGNVGWYRLFNWTGTGKRIGWRTSWRPASVVAKLTKAHAKGEQVFTGAHIVWSEGGKPKIEGVVESCTALWERRKYIAAIAKCWRSLEKTYDELIQVRGIGPFIAYEIVTDLRHTPVLMEARDVMTWANVGPGAARGLRRLYPGITPKEMLPAMRALLARSERQLPDGFPKMELRDVEHALCECDKMCRVKFGEGRPRSTYNGKEEESV